MVKIKAVIMSGGMGTRLRPLTCHLPKPMVPIFNKPNMEYTLELLKEYGIEDIAITLYYLPHRIMDYFGNGEKFNVNIKYYIEDTPLGTGGSVKNAQEFLDDTFIVISGDAFTNIDLKRAYEFHKEKKSKATLVLKREPIPLEYGVVITDGNGKIIKFLEKPSWGEVFSDTINTGIYILEPSVLDYYKVGENFDFSKDLFPKLLRDNVPIYGYVMEEYWCDVGDLDSYIETHRDVFIDKNKHYLLGKDPVNGIWLGENTIVEKGVEINPPIYIGENTIIRSGAVIEPYTVIGKNCIIGENTSIKRSIIWDNVKISSNCEIRKSVICNNVIINNKSRIFEGTVLGSHSIIESYATIKPNIKIWPYKKVGEKIVLKENLIWEERDSKKLFGDRNISRKLNQNISLETAVSLGAAIGTAIKPSGNFIVSCDEYNLSKLLKSSIISGLLSIGAQIIDIKSTSLPICRLGIKYFNGDGGIFIGRDIVEEDKVSIEVLDNKGANIDKNLRRKIENLLSIEDFKKVSGDIIQDTVSIDNFSSIYLREGKKQLKFIKEIQKEKPKIIISSPSKNILALGEKYLLSIGCNVETADYNMVQREEGIHNIVLDKNGDLGIVYYNNGEEILISDGFNIVSAEKYYLLNMLIGFKTGELEKATVPYNYPRIMEKIAKEYKINIEYSKSNISEILRGLLDRENQFQYILNFDGIWASGKLIDYLIGYNTTLNRTIQELPEYFYIKKEIPCKWNHKGNIIRRLSENQKDNMELIEGIRFIEDKGWALLVPDEEKPIFNLYIEGYTEEYAEELGSFYDEKIRNMLDKAP